MSPLGRSQWLLPVEWPRSSSARSLMTSRPQESWLAVMTIDAVCLSAKHSHGACRRVALSARVQVGSHSSASTSSVSDHGHVTGSASRPVSVTTSANALLQTVSRQRGADRFAARLGDAHPFSAGVYFIEDVMHFQIGRA